MKPIPAFWFSRSIYNHIDIQIDISPAAEEPDGMIFTQAQSPTGTVIQRHCYPKGTGTPKAIGRHGIVSRKISIPLRHPNAV